MLLLFVLIIIIRVPTSSDATVLFSHKKLEKHTHIHSNQHRGSAAASHIPATIWTHFQCDPKINPFMSVAFGCYCPGAWCSNNGQCCSQMCFKKTCY